MQSGPPGAGMSSFDLVDTIRLFEVLNLVSDSHFLDLACGRGQYTLRAADFISNEGAIYAVDLWPGGIAELRSQAQARGLDYIDAEVADIGKRIPIGDDVIDEALIASALHDLVHDGGPERALGELGRVLRPRGCLTVVEFKKVAGPPGPPKEVRLSPAQVDELLEPHRFRRTRYEDAGPYHYLCRYRLSQGP